MTLRVSAKSSKQKPLNDVDIKISTPDPGKRRGLEHSSAFHMAPKSTTTEDKVGSIYQFCLFQITFGSLQR